MSIVMVVGPIWSSDRIEADESPTGAGRVDRVVDQLNVMDGRERDGLDDSSLIHVEHAKDLPLAVPDHDFAIEDAENGASGVGDGPGDGAVDRGP